MKRIPYVTPSVKLLPIKFDSDFMVSTNTEAYEDYGDYEWD